MNQMSDLPHGEDFNIGHLAIDINEIPDGEVMKQVKSRLICYAIARFKGNMSRAAKWLGICRSSIYRRPKS